jgi:hypothetical protein
MTKVVRIKSPWPPRRPRPPKNPDPYFVYDDETWYYVYFLECSGYVKIGKSEPPSIKSRLRTIASCCPFPMTFLGAIASPERNSPLNERRIHARFAKHAHKNEWFTLNDEIRAFLDEYRSTFQYELPAGKVSALIDSFRQAPRSSKEYYDWIF